MALKRDTFPATNNTGTEGNWFTLVKHFNIFSVNSKTLEFQLTFEYNVLKYLLSVIKGLEALISNI